MSKAKKQYCVSMRTIFSQEEPYDMKIEHPWIGIGYTTAVSEAQAINNVRYRKGYPSENYPLAVGGHWDTQIEYKAEEVEEEVHEEQKIENRVTGSGRSLAAYAARHPYEEWIAKPGNKEAEAENMKQNILSNLYNGRPLEEISQMMIELISLITDDQPFTEQAHRARINGVATKALASAQKGEQ